MEGLKLMACQWTTGSTVAFKCRARNIAVAVGGGIADVFPRASQSPSHNLKLRLVSKPCPAGATLSWDDCPRATDASFAVQPTLPILRVVNESLRRPPIVHTHMHRSVATTPTEGRACVRIVRLCQGRRFLSRRCWPDSLQCAHHPVPHRDYQRSAHLDRPRLRYPPTHCSSS